MAEYVILGPGDRAVWFLEERAILEHLDETAPCSWPAFVLTREGEGCWIEVKTLHFYNLLKTKERKD